MAAALDDGGTMAGVSHDHHRHTQQLPVVEVILEGYRGRVEQQLSRGRSRQMAERASNFRTLVRQALSQARLGGLIARSS